MSGDRSGEIPVVRGRKQSGKKRPIRPEGQGWENGASHPTGINWRFRSTSPEIPSTLPVEEYCHI